MSEEDLHVCQQCTALRETLHECEGGCGREICDYCGPSCHDCKNTQEYDKHRRGEDEEAEEKPEWLKKQEAEVADAKRQMPKRGFGGEVWVAMDYVFGLADEALANELEYEEGEFDNYGNAELQDVLRVRYLALPAWKKALYKVKKNVDEVAAKAVLNVVQAAKVIEVNTALDPRAVRCWIIDDWKKLNEPDE